MKRITCFFLVLILFTMTNHAVANGTTTNEWGPVNCNAQISVQLKDPEKEIKINQTVNLVIYIKNVSTNETLYVFQSLAVVIDSYIDFSFNIISPSGKDISPKQSKYWNGGSAGIYPLLPGQVKEFSYNLSYICKFDEVGTYKVIVKKKFGLWQDGKCEAASNPLTITVSR